MIESPFTGTFLYDFCISISKNSRGGILEIEFAKKKNKPGKAYSIANPILFLPVAM